MKKLKLKRKIKVLLIVVVLLLTIFVGSCLFYQISLGSVSNSSNIKQVEIVKGSGSTAIAKTLKENNLIKNEYTFLIYVHLNKITDLKFGTYLLSENMSAKDIVKTLREGSKYDPDEVTLTIKEGTNMRGIAEIISSVTNNSYNSVIDFSNNVDYINKLKDKYWFITDSVDNQELYYKLEGYLYPETYKLKNKDVSVEYIFDKMIDQMAIVLDAYKDYDYSKMSIHDYLTLASMVEKESARESDRTKMASVFLNRMKKGMNLGSDVTSRYANKIDDSSQVLTYYQLNYFKSPYNTRLIDGSMNGKLPVGPISTVSSSAIKASFLPDEHDYLYFIANIQTTETFFYTNYDEFVAKKQELSEVNGGF